MMTDQKGLKMKYTIEVAYGATGYGWTKETNNLKDFEGFIDEHRVGYGVAVEVWYNTRHDFIFLKKALDFKPIVDDLHRIDRDYRTTTRNKKGMN